MKGFTLIELLVVVLIIGILAGMAVPQYQKAVEKSRLSALLPIARAVETAQKTYFMANGSFSGNMSDLDISVPLPHSGTPACNLAHTSQDASRWDDHTVVTLNNRPAADSYFVAAARKTGPFMCSGIKIPLTDISSLKSGRAYCYEHERDFKGAAGDFCVKLMNGTYVASFDSCRFYVLQ